MRGRAIAAAVAAVLVLAGCGGVGRSTRADLAGRAVAPSVVQVGGSSFDAQQFLAAVVSGTAPDLVFMDRQLIGTYAARGTLMPLTSCITDQHVDLGQYRPPALAEVTVETQGRNG